MQIYFYCSYAHSSRGFFMTRLDGTQLTAQAEEELPEIVSDFFSYARYRFLWRELGEFVQPEPEPEPQRESELTVEYTPGTVPGFGSEYGGADDYSSGYGRAGHGSLNCSGPNYGEAQESEQRVPDMTVEYTRGAKPDFNSGYGGSGYGEAGYGSPNYDEVQQTDWPADWPESDQTVEYAPGTAPDFGLNDGDLRTSLRGLWSSARRMVRSSQAFRTILQAAGQEEDDSEEDDEEYKPASGFNREIYPASDLNSDSNPQSPCAGPQMQAQTQTPQQLQPPSPQQFQQQPSGPQSPMPQSSRPQPKLKFKRSGAFLGLRELRGTLSDGRSATANLAILGDKAEAAVIRRIALEILGDYDAFENRLIGYLSVGGPCGYELDGEAFLAWMNACSTHNALHRAAGCTAGAGKLLRHMTKHPENEPELIRLAACSYDWEQMRRYFGGGPQWEAQPRGVLSVPEFQELFRGHGALWTMDEEPMPADS